MCYRVRGDRFVGKDFYSSWITNETVASGIETKEFAEQILLSAVRSGVWSRLHIEKDE